LPKPEHINEMFDMASMLSKEMSYSRIDLYEVDGKIYFGEITFFPDSGFDANLLAETDDLLGNLLDLEGV